MQGTPLLRISRAGTTAAVVGLGLALATSAAFGQVGDPCSPLSYGAVGDGVTDNTAAIQSAINACVKAGGGAVRLYVSEGKGRYLTGPVALASHVRLQLDKGVTLLGTTDHARYRAALPNRPYQPNEALVSAYRAVDTGVVGPGIIDGQGGAPALDGGASWWKATHPTGTSVDGNARYAAPHEDVPVADGAPRPWLVEFYECDNVAVNDITFTNAPMWNLVFRYSKHITVSEYTATVTPDASIEHTDGVDLIGSSYASLLLLKIATGGDGVALKSGLAHDAAAGQASTADSAPVQPGSEAGPSYVATHDVKIVNSTFTHGNGIVIGGEAVNGVYNIVARNIVENDARRGLTIESRRDSGTRSAGIYNIIAESVTMTNVRQPLAISVQDAAGHSVESRSDGQRMDTAATAGIHDITVSGLTATGATSQSVIVGLAESCVRNVNLNNVSISGRNAGLRLRNMTGALNSVTSRAPGKSRPLVLQENVTVTTTGTTPMIRNTPPFRSATRAATSACGNGAGS